MIFPSLAEPQVFRARALLPKAADRAFPLVQLSCPSIELRAWMEYVQAQAHVRRGTGGVTAVEDGRGYIHCVFCWNLIGHLTCRKSLRISDLVMAHLPGGELQAAVLAEVQALAEGTGTGAIVVDVGANTGGLRQSALLALGFKPAGQRFEMVLRMAC